MTDELDSNNLEEDIFNIRSGQSSSKLLSRNPSSSESPDNIDNRSEYSINSDNDPDDPSPIEKQYSIVEGFSTPLLFATFFDPNLTSGKAELHNWQAETLELFGTVKPTSFEPFKYCLCAANGSGKDAYVIAPLAVFFICCKIKALVIITSASGLQLTNQTEKYIVALCNKVNQFYVSLGQKPIIKVRKRRITCLLSGSEIMLFATDEGSKAEGYHPTEPNSEMLIIVNEAKSVIPEIFGALRRCTGFNYWINVSTPGEPRGEFYKSYKNWSHKRKVTYFDCPHQSPREFEDDKRDLGVHSPLFRSKWLAEFTFIGGKTVVNQTALEKLRDSCKFQLVKTTFKEREIRIGLDIALSGNGDETVISAFKGNRQTYMLCFRNKDAMSLAENIDRVFTDKLQLKKEHSYIFADDGGVGRAVIDILVRMGWTNINRVLNQSRAKRKRMFKNRGAELWFKFAKLIEHQAIILLDDNELHAQIASRKYKESTEAGIDLLTLQSKKSVMAEGLPSPDRADATVLALTDFEANEAIDEVSKEIVKAIKESTETTARRLQNELRKLDVNGEQRLSNGKRSGLSLNALLGGRSKLYRFNKLLK